MIPSIDQNTILQNFIHPIDQLQTKAPTQKTKKIKKKSQWDSKMKIVSFSIPQVNQSQTMVRKYKIRIVYETPDGKRIPKTIFFGDESDYVFNHDQNKRVRRLLSMKHLDNPLHPNYWKALLLNKYQTMKQGLDQFTEYFLQSQKKQLQKKQNKSGKMPTLSPSTLIKKIQ